MGIKSRGITSPWTHCIPSIPIYSFLSKQFPSKVPLLCDSLVIVTNFLSLVATTCTVLQISVLEHVCVCKYIFFLCTLCWILYCKTLLLPSGLFGPERPHRGTTVAGFTSMILQFLQFFLDWWELKCYWPHRAADWVNLFFDKCSSLIETLNTIHGLGTVCKNVLPLSEHWASFCSFEHSQHTWCLKFIGNCSFMLIHSDWTVIVVLRSALYSVCSVCSNRFNKVPFWP